MAENEKLTILYLMSILLDDTDREHMLNADDLCGLLDQRYNVTCSRKTIYRDVDRLREYGLKIGQVKGSSPGYYIEKRDFELAELKMLVDAVSSSRFITMGKSEMLISKLAKLTNEQNRAALTARIFTADRIKTSNTVVFHTTDTICRAMEDGKKIRFHYWNYNPQKEHILRHDGEWFIASPYALIWDDERYYLAAYSDFREKVVTFRVDRMCDVEITEEAAVRDDSFNAGEFAKTTFKMMDEDFPDSKVILICDNQFMQNVVDRFGEEIETTVLDDNCFRAIVTVRPSKTFFSWVVGFCGGIRIAEPADVKERFEETLRMVLSCQSAI